MKGPPPTPTHLKVVRGNPGRRPLPKDEPQPEPGAAMPDWLSPDAARHWPVVSKMLDDCGILTQVDAAALGMYCEAFARFKDANDHVAKYGTVVKAPSGFPVQSPYLSIANKAFEQLVKLQIEFGMTPSSRTRVAAASGAKKKATNRFARNGQRVA